MKLRDDNAGFTPDELRAYLRKPSVSEDELMRMNMTKLYQIIYADQPSRFQNNGKKLQSIQIRIIAKP